jgi:hypothetical protein
MLIDSKSAGIQYNNNVNKYTKAMKDLTFISFDDLVTTQNLIWKQTVLNLTTTDNWEKDGQIVFDCPVFLKKICLQTFFIVGSLKKEIKKKNGDKRTYSP